MKSLYKLSVLLISMLICISVIALGIAIYVINLNSFIFIVNLLTDNLMVQCMTIAISIIIITSGLLIILNTKNNKSPIVLEGENGELIITRTTLENISNNVAKSFFGTQEVMSKIIINRKDDISINISIQVEPNVSISELTQNIQLKVKEEIKNITEIEVASVNLKVRNIYEKKAEKIQE